MLQRRSGCWFFGEPGRCSAWNLLIALFCTFAAVDSITTLATSLCGSQSMDNSQRCFPHSLLSKFCYFVNIKQVCFQTVVASCFDLHVPKTFDDCFTVLSPFRGATRNARK